MGFILGLDVAHERKRGVMDDSKVFVIGRTVAEAETPVFGHLM